MNDSPHEPRGLTVRFATAVATATLVLLLAPPAPAAPAAKTATKVKTAAAKPAASPSPTPIPATPNGSYTPSMEDLPVPPAVNLPAPEYVPSSVPSTPLGLMEAVRIALVYQPNMTVALAGVQAAQARTQQVRSGTLPTVSISATGSSLVTASGTGVGASFSSGAGSTAGLQTTGSTAQTASGSTVGGSGVNTAATSAALGSTASGVSGASSGFNVGLNGYFVTTTLRQLVFDFNHTRQLIRQSMAQERSAFANLSQVQQTLVFQVKQGYFQHVQNLRLVTVQEKNLKNQQEHLRLTQARYRAGLGLPSDVVRAQTAVASAIFNLNQAQNTASISRVNLAVLMGVDPRTPIDVQMEGQSEQAIDTSNPQALFRLALEQRPDILQSIANLQASQYAVAAAKTNNAPSLAATANYNTRATNPTLFDYHAFSVGFQLTWAVFDAGLTRARVREARANELSNQAQLMATRQNALSDVAQAYLNLKTAEQRLVTSASEVQNAQESVRLITGRYRAGLGTFLDVLDAEQALVTAETNQVNAQSAVDQARAAMARALGMPLPDVPDAGTAVPPPPQLRIPAPPTEAGGAWPIPTHPGAPSNAPGAPAARTRNPSTSNGTQAPAPSPAPDAPTSPTPSSPQPAPDAPSAAPATPSPTPPAR